jgi:hypothetical protein
MIKELKWQIEFDKNHGFDTETFVAMIHKGGTNNRINEGGKALRSEGFHPLVFISMSEYMLIFTSLFAQLNSR